MVGRFSARSFRASTAAVAVALVRGAVLLALAVVLAGCAGSSSSGQTSVEGPPPGTEREDSATGGQVDTGRPAEAMPFDMRKAQLPASFPIEIPVPLGRIVDVVEQDEGGTGVWTYELESGSSVSALADWYQRSYASANWLVAERTQADPSQITLAFAKGEAQSVIQIRTAEGGSIVQASVGLGIPVAETY